MTLSTYLFILLFVSRVHSYRYRSHLSHYIAAIIVGILVTAITFPLMLMSPDMCGGTKEFIRSTGIFVAVLCTMCILHGRRSVLLWLDFDIDENHNLNRKSSVTPIEPGLAAQQGESADEGKYGGAERDPYQEVKTKKLNYRQQIGKQQVAYWYKKMRHTEAMLLGEAEGGAAMRRRRIIPGSLVDQPERIPPQATESDTPYWDRTAPALAPPPPVPANPTEEVSETAMPVDSADSPESSMQFDPIPDPLSPIEHQHLQ